MDCRTGAAPQNVELRPVKLRCAFCHAAFQEPRGFRFAGKVEIALMCHRCGRLNHIEVDCHSREGGNDVAENG